MAHRGRLNVLVNTLGKMPANLFAEFEGKHAADLSAGDVKYHQGFSSDVVTPGGPMHLTLAFNPSHLEIVDPVVEGSVRARQDRRARSDLRPGHAGADPRRRGDCRAGRGAGNAQPGADARLPHRRHDPHRRQQPDRLHHVRSARHARHAVLHRRREDGRGADLPRQRRRSRGVPAGHRDRDRLPPEVRQGRVHRPRLLPPAGPQRSRRADDHAAADVQEHPRSIRARARCTRSGSSTKASSPRPRPRR